MKTINKTTNGKVFTCGKCNAIHVEYKNINFNLSKTQFKEYANYLQELNGQEWERINKDSNFTRKIIIPTQDTHIKLILNNVELKELKTLFGCKKMKPVSEVKNLELLQFYHLN